MGIVFTQSIQMDGQAGGQQEKACPGCICEVIGC